MANSTPIQWADSTINPIMGCDGCPLYPNPATIASTLVANLPFPQTHRTEVRRVVAEVFADHPTTNLYHLRAEVAQKIAAGLATIEALESSCDLPTQIEQEISSQVRCYAALLHAFRGQDVRNPDKYTNKGYAPTFEQVTKFAGRMLQASKWSDLGSQDRSDAPWLNGLPRLIFVSDMGDALSQSVDFPYLKQEIIDVVNSAHGNAHVWLWLTKRPRRMAQFAKWLEKQGVPWPDNLVPMTSVMDRTMAKQVKYLLDIPAKARGLSVEPLWEGVDLDLTGIDWVIVGGESGTYAKPFDLEWARSLQAQCRRAGTSFFMKQLGAKPVQEGKQLTLINSHGGDWDEWPEDLRVREMPAVFTKLAVSRPIKTKRLN